MRVIVIWLLCSVPLILTVLTAVKAASSSNALNDTVLDLLAPTSGAYASLTDIDENFPDKVAAFSWYEVPSASEDGISVGTSARPEFRQIQTASVRLLTINRGLREVAKGFENPQLSAELQSFVDATAVTNGDLKKLGELPVASSIRRCVDVELKKRKSHESSKTLRKTALENYTKGQKDPDVLTLDKVIASVTALPLADLTETDREQLRWAKFWKYWFQAKSNLPLIDVRAMKARQELLEHLTLQSDDPSIAPVKPDEVRFVENCSNEAESLKTRIRFEEIKEEIRDNSPESWIADAESLFGQLNVSDARQLTKLIRESMLKRVVVGDPPVAKFQEAITKSDDLWMGSFALADPNATKKRYKFVSTSGEKDDYAYLSQFKETHREPFAITAYQSLKTAFNSVQSAPGNKAAWQEFRDEASRLADEKTRYLKLNKPVGKADRKLVDKSLESLKFEEIHTVCEQILSEDMWPRIERLLGKGL